MIKLGKHRKVSISVLFLLLVTLALGTYVYKINNRVVVLQFGTFSGSMYDVPNWQYYKAIDEAIEEFEKIHPNIKIEYRSGILKSDYSEWLAQSILKGEEPDVFCVLPGDFNTFSSIGVLKDLDTFINRDGEFNKNNIYTNALKSGQFKGDQFALPKEIDPELMCVNKTLLEKENIPMPNENWTWQDFYDICQKVTKDKDGDGKLDQFGAVDFSWQHAVYTNGQQLFDSNGEKAYFNSEDVKESIKFVTTLNKLNDNNKVNYQDFDAGKVVFRPIPFSVYRAYKVYPYKIMRYREFEWETIKLPKGPQGNNASQLNSFLMGMSSRTKYQKEAWEFLKFLTHNKDIQMDIFKYSHGMPVLKDVMGSAETDIELAKYSEEENISINKKSLEEVVDQSIVTPKFHKYEEAMDMADKEIFQLISIEKDIDEAMNKLNKDINEFLDY